MVSAVLAAEYYRRNSDIQPKLYEKMIIITSMTVVGFVVQFLFSKYFRVNAPNEFYLVIGPIFMWFPFARITKKHNKIIS